RVAIPARMPPRPDAPAPVLVEPPPPDDVDVVETDGMPLCEGSEGGTDDETVVDRLTDRLRADPNDNETAIALADALERLGRDLDLLALVSARIEEGDEAARAAFEPRRRGVLVRLAGQAREAGRTDEAALYESMLGL